MPNPRAVRRAYATWLGQGNTGTEVDFLAFLDDPTSAVGGAAPVDLGGLDADALIDAFDAAAGGDGGDGGDPTAPPATGDAPDLIAAYDAARA